MTASERFNQAAEIIRDVLAEVDLPAPVRAEGLDALDGAARAAALAAHVETSARAHARTPSAA